MEKSVNFDKAIRICLALGTIISGVCTILIQLRDNTYLDEKHIETNKTNDYVSNLGKKDEIFKTINPPKKI